MDAREIIAESLHNHGIAFPTPEEATDWIVGQLAASGFDITHRDENHGPTRDRAAAIARNTFVGDSLAPTFRISEAIRAMEVKNA